MSAWGYYALLGDRRLTRASMDATQAGAVVARRMFFPASASTLTLTPDAGAVALAGAAVARLASTLRPAAGAMTVGQGSAPSIGGVAWGDTPGDGHFLLML